MCDGENKMWVEQVRVRGRGGRVLHQELKPSPLHSCHLARLSPVFDGTACFTTSLLHWRHDTVICVMVSERSWGEEERAMVVGGLDQGLLCTCMIMS